MERKVFCFQNASKFCKVLWVAQSFIICPGAEMLPLGTKEQPCVCEKTLNK